MSQLRHVLVLPDLHAPYHDGWAFELFLQVAEDVEPDIIVIIGDFMDCYAVSQHMKDPERKNSFEWELTEAAQCLDRLDSLGIRRKVFCMGNHEDRFRRYLAKDAPALAGMRGMTIPELLELDERGWEVVDYKESIKIGKAHFTHDVGRAGKHALRQGLQDFGHNLIHGHTHRGGTAYQGTVSGESHVGLDVGWMGDEKFIDYKHKDMVRRDWQLGFGEVYLEEGGNCHAHFIPIVRYRCVVKGKLFQV